MTDTKSESPLVRYLRDPSLLLKDGLALAQAREQHLDEQKRERDAGGERRQREGGVECLAGELEHVVQEQAGVAQVADERRISLGVRHWS